MRDELWKKLIERPPLGYVLQLWSSRAPRGFDYRQYGESKRMLDDFEGLALVVLRSKNRKNRNVQRRTKKETNQDKLAIPAEPPPETRDRSPETFF